MSCIAVFDFILSVRILCESDMLQLFFPGLILPAKYLQGIQLCVLMADGICGCYLIGVIFSDSVMAVTTRILCSLYFFIGVVYLFVPLKFLPYLNLFVAAVYIATLVDFAFIIISRLRKDRDAIIIIHAVKTVYIGIVIFIDILMVLGFVKGFEYLYWFYLPFFLMHVYLRLWDSKHSYDTTDLFIGNLEKMVAERTAQLTEVNERLANMMVHDPLTGICNRLYFEQHLSSLIASRNGNSPPLSLCMIDIDYFKKVNDTYGHDVGDAVLVEFARVVNKYIGKNMIFARVGGEEFVILVSGLDFSSVRGRMEYIRQRVEKNLFPHDLHITASFGLTEFRPEFTMKDFFKAADVCLYQAKQAGRNCVKARKNSLPPDVLCVMPPAGPDPV